MQWLRSRIVLVNAVVLQQFDEAMQDLRGYVPSVLAEALQHLDGHMAMQWFRSRVFPVSAGGGIAWWIAGWLHLPLMASWCGWVAIAGIVGEVMMSCCEMCMLWLRRNGRYREALRWSRLSSLLSYGLYGKKSVLYAITLKNLVDLYQLQGCYEEVESLYRTVLGICQQELGSTHLSTAIVLDSLAGFYLMLWRYEEAEALYREVRNIYQKKLGSTHPNTMNSLNNLAFLYEMQGRYEEAEALYREAREVYQQSDPIHLNAAAVLGNLARLYQALGNYEEAEQLYQDALCIRQKQLRAAHRMTAAILNNLGRLHQRLGRYEEAEAFYRKALDIYWQSGFMHPDTAHLCTNLGCPNWSNSLNQFWDLTKVVTVPCSLDGACRIRVFSGSKNWARYFA